MKENYGEKQFRTGLRSKIKTIETNAGAKGQLGKIVSKVRNMVQDQVRGNSMLSGFLVGKLHR